LSGWRDRKGIEAPDCQKANSLAELFPLIPARAGIQFGAPDFANNLLGPRLRGDER
jgi:hypothetical protein